MTPAPATLRHLAITPDGRGAGWRMAREAGPDPAAALLGRTPEDAARLAPLVFNLCGAAHGLAAASALGLPATADTRAMARETVRDHALAMLHTWPGAVGAPPDREALSLLARPGGEAAFAAALVGDGSDLPAFSLAEMEAWLQEAPTATARLLGRIRREVDPAEGRAGLPELTADGLSAALRAAAAPASRPPVPPVEDARTGDGHRTGGDPSASRTTTRASAMAAGDAALRETGALGRVAATPLLSALLAGEGPSLFVRLLARLADCLIALRSPPVLVPAPEPGLGLAPAARGLLGHAARVENGRVASYRILSPSSWNLSPGGLMERAFAALTPGRQAPWLAPLLVSAINPCVPVTLSTAQELAHA